MNLSSDGSEPLKAKVSLEQIYPYPYLPKNWSSDVGIFQSRTCKYLKVPFLKNKIANVLHLQRSNLKWFFSQICSIPLEPIPQTATSTRTNQAYPYAISSTAIARTRLGKPTWHEYYSLNIVILHRFCSNSQETSKTSLQETSTTQKVLKGHSSNVLGYCVGFWQRATLCFFDERAILWGNDSMWYTKVAYNVLSKKFSDYKSMVTDLIIWVRNRS